MSLRFIYGRAGYGKSTFCLEDIKNNLKSEETHPLILVVPEQFSFQAEKNLILALDKDENLRARVFSFRRMAYKVFSEVGGLTRQHVNLAGRAMLIFKLLNLLKGELKVYSKSAAQSGFVDTIAEIITELKKYNITVPELLSAADITTNDALKCKLLDISLIYDKYETTVHEKYIDTEDDMTMLYEKLEKSQLFEDAEIYFDEFSSFTPQQYRIIERLMKKAKRINITLNMDNSKGLVQNTDLFSVTKSTEERILKIAQDNNISLDKNIYLTGVNGSRFVDSPQLKHLEKHLYSYPYQVFKTENIKNSKELSINTFKALNIYTEVEETARDIIRLIRENPTEYRYRDIVIAGRNIKSYEGLVKAIFGAYEIPCFIDERREITGNPLIVFIVSLLDILEKNWSYEAVFRYLKTGMTELDKEEIDLIENYVLATGIKGKKWQVESWDYKTSFDFNGGELSQSEAEYIKKINEIKNKITTPLNEFYKKFSEQKNGRELCKTLFEYLETNKLFEKINGYIDTFKINGDMDRANEYSQVWNVVINVLDQIVEVVGEDSLTKDEFSKIMMIGFSEYSAGLIPPALDQVILGSVDRMRSHNIKALYLIGVNDGVFPKAQNDEGILNDMDRETLKNLGVELPAGTRAKTFEEQFTIYSTLSSPSKYLRISYPMADFDGKTLRPSTIISKIKKIFPELEELSSLIIENTEEENLRLISSPLPTFNELITFMRRDKDGTKLNPIWEEVYKWYASSIEWRSRTEIILEGLQYTNQVEEIEKERAKKLYGKDMLFSVSRLEKYAACPFAYFMKYGLNVKERKIYRPSAPDLGTFMHNVLNEFSIILEKERTTWREVDKAFCTEAVNIIVDNMVEKLPGNILNSSPRYKYLGERLKRMLVTALWIISEHIKRSDFEPEGYEEGFGPYDKYPPIKIILEDGNEINLIGRIDRLDFMETSENNYVRIIDYKSGNKDIKLTDIYYGLQLQLLIYLDAILKGVQKEEGSSLLPAGILYFKIDNPIIGFRSDSELSDEAIEKAILKELKLKGLLLDNLEVIQGMDREIEGYSDIIPASLKKDGTLGRSRIVSNEQFDILRKYVKSTIKELCTEMLGGNITIKPYKKSKETPCTFCDYSSVCQFDTSIKGNDYRVVNERAEDQIWELMKKVTDSVSEGEGGDNNG